uniref:Uncharacterized protein n=1 Tax=Cyanothece sp. (strain PCC 7425 / ATCC 29141) TaxID=395961 RepID=B8HTG1_CYAP4
MKLLPYDRFSLETTAPLEVVRERLASQVEPPKNLRWPSRNHLPYQGQVGEDGFTISRVLDYRNSFAPIIWGRFACSETGTIVQITMGLHSAVAVLLSLWLLFWYSMIIPVVLFTTMPTSVALLFVGVPVVALVIFSFAFWYEANRSRRDLTQIILEDY